MNFLFQECLYHTTTLYHTLHALHTLLTLPWFSNLMLLNQTRICGGQKQVGAPIPDHVRGHVLAHGLGHGSIANNNPIIGLHGLLDHAPLRGRFGHDQSGGRGGIRGQNRGRDQGRTGLLLGLVRALIPVLIHAHGGLHPGQDQGLILRGRPDHALQRGLIHQDTPKKKRL